MTHCLRFRATSGAGELVDLPLEVVADFSVGSVFGCIGGVSLRWLRQALRRAIQDLVNRAAGQRAQFIVKHTALVCGFGCGCIGTSTDNVSAFAELVGSGLRGNGAGQRSEETTSELQS